MLAPPAHLTGARVAERLTRATRAVACILAAVVALFLLAPQAHGMRAAAGAALLFAAGAASRGPRP